MTESLIRGNYQLINTNGMNQNLIQSKGINDLKTTEDNVLDISDLSRLQEEISLDPTDINNIKFVKISSNQYIDLSDPQQKMDLINKLKANILEKGKVKSSFSSSSFQENTGISLNFETSIETASNISKATDIMLNLTRSVYNSNFNNPKIFGQISGQIDNQISEIDSELNKLNLDPLKNKSEIDKLNNIRSFALSLKDVYQFIGTSNKPVSKSQMQQVSDQLLSKIRTVTSNLSNLRASDIGRENYLNMTNTLEDLTSLCEGYSTHAAVGNASNDLSRFTLQSYERIREIKSGERVRKNETPDMKGAITSFSNDNSDMQTFMRQISRVSNNISSYNSKDDFVRAMLNAVNSSTTSRGFSDSIRNLASSKWEQNLARQEITMARQKLTEGNNNINSANQNLQTVIGDGTPSSGLLQRAGNLYALSENSRFANKGTEASQLLSQVKVESQQIQMHLREYERLKALGQANLSEAQNHLNEANKAATRAQGYAEKVLKGNYSRELGPQAQDVINAAQQIKFEANSIMSDITTLRESVERTDQIAETVINQSNNLNLEVESRLLLESKISDVKKAILSEIKSTKGFFGGDLASPELIDFLSNPDKPITKEERAKYLEELTSLISDNPNISKVYSQQIMELRNSMQSFISQKAGNDSNLALHLENQLIDGLLSSQLGIVFEASTTEFKPDESGGIFSTNNMQPVQQWVLETRNNYSRQMLTQDDPNVRASFNKFDETLKMNPEMRQKYNDFLSNHPNNGSPQSIPMSIAFNKGMIVNFDVRMIKDTKTNEYCIFNPYDGGVYKGKTPEDAMKAFSENSHLGDGKLNYRDTKGNVISTQITAPENSLGTDLLMGGAGLVGGVLLFVPEPTLLTKVAAGGLIGTSSAYFMQKGGTELYNLYQTERAGWNKETFFASLDVATGLLGVLEGAGVALQATKTGSGVLKTSTALAESSDDVSRLASSTGKTALSEADKLAVIQSTVRKYVELTSSKAFNATNIGLNMSSVTLGTASKIYDITQMDITNEEKAKKIAEALASTLVPIGIAAASHSIMRAKTKSDFISTASKELDNITSNINQAKINPITSESLSESLSQLQELENKLKIKAEALGDPKIAEVGLERVKTLKTQIENLMQQGSVINSIMKDPKIQELSVSIADAEKRIGELKLSMESLDPEMARLHEEIKKRGLEIRKATTPEEKLAIRDILRDLQGKFDDLKAQRLSLESEKKAITRTKDSLVEQRETLITEFGPKQDIPMGFKDRSDFQKTVNTYMNNSYVKEFATDSPVIGVRGSSIYGASPIKGTHFRGESDLDIFIVSNNLYQEGIKRLAEIGITPASKNFEEYVRNGYLTGDAIKKVFPDFLTTDSAVSEVIGRKSSIRVMSTEGFDRIKTGKEVLGE